MYYVILSGIHQKPENPIQIVCEIDCNNKDSFKNLLKPCKTSFFKTCYHILQCNPSVIYVVVSAVSKAYFWNLRERLLIHNTTSIRSILFSDPPSLKFSLKLCHFHVIFHAILQASQCQFSYFIYEFRKYI